MVAVSGCARGARRTSLFERALKGVAQGFQPAMLDIHWDGLYNRGAADWKSAIQQVGKPALLKTGRFQAPGDASLIQLHPERFPEAVAHILHVEFGAGALDNTFPKKGARFGDDQALGQEFFELGLACGIRERAEAILAHH